MQGLKCVITFNTQNYKKLQRRSFNTRKANQKYKRVKNYQGN